MAGSYAEIDHGDYISRLLANYRSSFVAYDGEPFGEPAPTAADQTPVDWIVPRLSRSESERGNTENDQWRDIRLVIWLAFQPGRGDLADRRAAIRSDLDDAMSLARSTNGNHMLGSFQDVGKAEAPPGLELSHRWDWEAVFYDGTFTEQPV